MPTFQISYFFRSPRFNNFFFVLLLLTVPIVGCKTGSKSKLDPAPDSKSPSQSIQSTEDKGVPNKQDKRDNQDKHNKLDKNDVLTHEEAILRSKRISNVSYTLWFDLSADSLDFQGRTTVEFDFKPHAKHTKEPIFLEFEEGKLSGITLNGTPVDNLTTPSRFDGHRIYFEPNELLPRANKIEITYSHLYSNDGRGLHRFKDPADGQVYLYSNSEPYDAHRLFPCFDQPDLKATYQVTTIAPKGWQVISNTKESAETTHEKQSVWTFPRSAAFSTYLFALHAGPYSVWKATVEDIPLRLLSRKSLAKYVDHEEWLDITKKGLQFFSTQFGFPYPFLKYDQIIVPDFNAGAMENVGAVTFSERYVYRTKVTQDKHRSRADTILHEMAHMWFGDLVTMKWWNGLWLNESFATLMATWAVEQTTPFKGSWQDFFAHYKQWAYWEDQLVTTHPIEVPVPTTDHAKAIFDGITYGKGASSLKQLRFYLGEEEFIEGVRRYFQKFSYQNTTLKDFFRMLAEASGKELKTWQHQWLQTSGVNTVRADWECNRETSKITKFNLIQTSSSPFTGQSISGTILQPNVNSPSPPTGGLRPHRIEIALLYSAKGKNAGFTSKQPLDITYRDELTPVPEVIGKPCPQIILPNINDSDYVKVELDRASLQTVRSRLNKISDPLARQMLWHILWEMVIDGKIRPQDYADTVLNHSSHEKNTLVLSTVLKTLGDPHVNKDSVLKFLEQPERGRYRSKFEVFVQKNLLQAPSGSDLQLTWYQAFLRLTSQPESVRFAKDLLQGTRKLKGLPIDQEHRWELIQALARNGASNEAKNDMGKTVQMILTELDKDPTDIGEKAAIAAEASLPDPKIKEGWLSQILHKSDAETPVTRAILKRTPSLQRLPIGKLREAMRTYFILDQEKWIEASTNGFFEELPKAALSQDSEEKEYSIWLAELFFPSLCSPTLIEKTTLLLESYPHLPPTVVKSLRISRQEEDRCIRARQRAQEKELLVF